jgi:hypothetical protein
MHFKFGEKIMCKRLKIKLLVLICFVVAFFISSLNVNAQTPNSALDECSNMESNPGKHPLQSQVVCYRDLAKSFPKSGYKRKLLKPCWNIKKPDWENDPPEKTTNFWTEKLSCFENAANELVKSEAQPTGEDQAAPEAQTKPTGAENDVPADTGARDKRECAPIMNKYDPYGTFVCINETKCQEEEYTWMDFNTASESGFPGCSTESPSIIAARAKATLTEFSGNRSGCSRDSAWQGNCSVDLAPCFALKDIPENIEGLTPRVLGILQENSDQCQTAMPLCTTANAQATQSTQNNDNPYVTLLPDGFAEVHAISQGEFTTAMEGFIDWGTKGGYECAKSYIEQNAGSTAQSCASMLTLGVSDYLFFGADLLISLLESEPKCKYNTDSSSSGDMFSFEKQHDFGDWGMFPRSVRLECGKTKAYCEEHGADGSVPCNMGAKSLGHDSCDRLTEAAQGILRCEERHGEPREGVDCSHNGGHGKETKDAEDRCPDDWRDVDKCPIDDEILNGKQIDEGSLYSWWPLQEGATHPWANKEGFCENNNYDDEGYCEGYDSCAQNPWEMSVNQREKCKNAVSKVGKSGYEGVGDKDMCDTQEGVQPMGC